MISFSPRLNISILALLISFLSFSQDFQGQAYYVSKSGFDFGTWGARFTQAQKQQVKERLKNRLQKTYILTFNREESIFTEEEKLDAISGATDSWGKNFSPGDIYKNIKSNELVQNQELYNKKFLVKDKLQSIKWQIGSETKKIGNYTCIKAKALIPSSDLTWYSFSWGDLSNSDDENNNDTEKPTTLTEVEAWYTPQIPVSQGPSEYWGLPGLILEVSSGNTTILCSKIILNPEEKLKINTPNKGKVIAKKEYKETINKRMQDFRNNRVRRTN